MLLEKRGIPATSIGEEALVKSVGLAIMKAHGMPDFPVALIPETRFLEQLRNEEELRLLVKTAAVQVEAILIEK